MNRIFDLRNKRNTLWEKTKNFLEENRDENGMVPAAALEQYDKMTADVKSLGEEIKRLEDQMEMDAKLSAPTSAPVHADPKADTRKPARPTATDAYNRAFWDMMRGNSSLEVRDALSVGVNENGGFTQFVMLPERELNAVSSYVMTPLPEVMRPYRELFARQTRDFFHPDTDRVRNPGGLAASLTPKLQQYMLGGPGDAVRGICRRREHLQLSPWKALGDDVLPALDSCGRIGYRKLWEK